MAFSLFKWLITCVFAISSSGIGYAAEEKTAYSIQKFNIGVLLPAMPFYFDSATFYKDERESILQTVEALYYAVDSINKDNTILPNITLDLDIKSYQIHEGTAIKQTLKLAKKALCYDKQSEDIFKCSGEEALLGIILPNDLENRGQIEELLSTLEIPQISFTEPQNENRQKYWNLESSLGLPRPPNKKSVPMNFFYAKSLSSGNVFMIEAVIEILAKYNIKCVAVTYTYNENFDVVKYFRKLAAQNSICITDVIESKKFTRQSGDPLVKLSDIMSSYDTVDTIVSFCDSDELTHLFYAIAGGGANPKKFFVIGGGSQHPSYYRSDAALAELYLTPKPSPIVPEFEKYYTSLTAQNNQKNPWFVKFWENNFNCKINPVENEQKCSGSEKFDGYKQHPLVPNVIRSVYILAQALQRTLKSYSSGRDLSLSDLQNSIESQSKSVTLNLFGEDLVFDPDTRMPISAKFDIYNYQNSTNGSPIHVKIGEYSRSLDLSAAKGRGNGPSKRTGPGSDGIPISKQLQIGDSFVLPASVKRSCEPSCLDNMKKCLKDSEL